MRRLILSLSAVALITGFVAPPPAAAQQSLDVYAGGFRPRSFDARGLDDVLFENANFLTFDIKDFDGATAGADWLIGLGEYFDAGLGLGVYSRTVPAVYTDFVNADGSEIQTDLKLRVVPFTATFRWLPIGRRDVFVPYVGAGVGVYTWRYAETGEFVDFTDNSIFRDNYVATGSSVGPVVLGGVRVPIGRVGVGGEIRYQAARGDLPADLGFAGPKIDLGGFNYLFVLNVKF